MPRTIESLVDSHRAAAERREAGRPVWDHRLRIKHLLTDDESDENAQQVGKEVAAIIRASTWARADQKERGGNSEVIMCAEEFEDVDDLDHFNAVLDHLYDLADADRAWIG